MRTGQDDGQGESALAKCPGDAAGRREQGRLGSGHRGHGRQRAAMSGDSEEPSTGLQGCPSKGHQLGDFSH